MEPLPPMAVEANPLDSSASLPTEPLPPLIVEHLPHSSPSLTNAPCNTTHPSTTIALNTNAIRSTMDQGAIITTTPNTNDHLPAVLHHFLPGSTFEDGENALKETLLNAIRPLGICEIDCQILH